MLAFVFRRGSCSLIDFDPRIDHLILSSMDSLLDEISSPCARRFDQRLFSLVWRVAR